MRPQALARCTTMDKLTWPGETASSISFGRRGTPATPISSQLMMIISFIPSHQTVHRWGGAGGGSFRAKPSEVQESRPSSSIPSVT